MNRDLMMKAVNKFGGVWPGDEQFKNERYNPKYGAILYTHTMSTYHPNEPIGTISLGELDADTDCYYIINRLEFESFVESLFEGAPEGTTHCSPEDEENSQVWWKNDGDTMFCICEDGDIYAWEMGHFYNSLQLIPRPVKKEKQPIQSELEPYAPKPLEYCELLMTSGNWHRVFVTFVGRQHVVFMLDGDERIEYTDFKRFRPIITERDTRAVELYRMFHNDGLQDREIMQSDKFNTYLSMFDILVRIQRGDV